MIFHYQTFYFPSQNLFFALLEEFWALSVCVVSVIIEDILIISNTEYPPTETSRVFFENKWFKNKNPNV